MWPNIFGPGWIWGALVALSFACFILGVLGFLLIAIKRPAPTADASVDQLFHRLEEGDITREEFERIKRVEVRR